MRNGIPFTVKLRAYIFHAIIAAISLVVSVLVFLFCAVGATKACAEIKRVADSPHGEFIIAGEPYAKDSFYYLNQLFIAGEKGSEVVSCDLLMTLQGAEYKENCLYFSGSLADGTCAVSANLAARYGLNLGDTATIVGTGMKFTVARLLPAQSGVNKENASEGVVILAYEKAAISGRYGYAQFSSGEAQGAYPSLVRLEFLSEWDKSSRNSLAIYAVVSVICFLLTAGVCEYFLFAQRRRDYALTASLGRGRVKTYFVALFENALKYLLPLAIVAPCFIPELGCYGAAFALVALFDACARLVAVAVYSLFVTRRLYKCRAKIKG